MAKKIDLTGQRFGKLLVLYEAPKIGDKIHWMCKCECGNKKSVSTAHLRNGNVTSCGLCEHDFIGRHFGRLEVLSISKRERTASDSVKIYFNCKCACGNNTEVVYQLLKNGKTKSCGCLRRERAISKNITHNQSKNITHNQSKTRLYKIYMGIKKRCYNEKADNYSYYGGKGIKLCEEWQDFEPFMIWALENGYSEKLSIDRIDSNGDYEPSNCRWVDAFTQANNRSNNTFLEFEGERKTIAEWARTTGIKCTTISKRLRDGWSVEDALTKKIQKNQYC